MAVPIPTNLADILTSLQARLMDVLGWPEERVIIDMRDDHDADTITSQAEQYVRLKAGPRNPLGADVEARGRIQPRMSAQISVRLRTRVNLDKAQSDVTALTDASRGHLRVEAGVWDALLNFQPVDGDSNWLVSETVKPRLATAPQKPPAGWAQTTINFDVTFIMDLDQSYQ